MPGSGVMKSLSTGDRVFVLPARTWALAEETLFQRFSTGAVVILQEMGETYGREFGLYLKEKKLDLATGKGLLQSLTRGAGWGDLEVEWRGGRSILFTLRDCAFCSDAVPSGLGRCHFVVGMALGFGREFLGEKVRASETRCMRSGGEACLIELT